MGHVIPPILGGFQGVPGSWGAAGRVEQGQREPAALSRLPELSPWGAQGGGTEHISALIRWEAWLPHLPHPTPAEGTDSGASGLACPMPRPMRSEHQKAKASRRELQAPVCRDEGWGKGWMPTAPAIRLHKPSLVLSSETPAQSEQSESWRSHPRSLILSYQVRIQ